LDIGVDLRPPEICAGLWPPKEVAIVAVPETAVDKDHRPTTGEDKIRPARQPFDMEAVAKASGM